MALIEQFHFIRPLWLLAVIPLIVIAVFLGKIVTRQSGWQQFISHHLYQFMVEGKTVTRSQGHFWLLGVAWLLGAIALAGPTWEKRPQPVFQVERGHVIVLDMSLSMRATDLAPNRLDRAKYKAIDLITMLDSGETGLVAYAGDAFVISPLTEDANTITTLLPSLSPEIMPVAGSDPLLGFEAAANLLKNAGYTQGDIFWITDGIDLEQSAELLDYVSALPYTVSALAVGTSEGAPIKQINGELLKDRSGGIVIPKLTASLVQNVVSSSGGGFSQITADDTDLRILKAQSKRLIEQQKDNNPSEQGDSWKEFGPFLLLIVLPLAAYSFRRGVLYALVISVLGFFPSEKAMANDTPSDQEANTLSWWKKPFLNADQQGQLSFTQQQFEQAATQFDDPNWKASAYYRAGDYEKALEYFAQSESADAFYNQGNALAQLGQYDDAIAAYDKALELNPELEDARDNKALLEQLKQQSSESQQPQNSGEDPSSDQNQSGQQNGDNQNQQSSGDQTDEQSSQSGQTQNQSSESANRDAQPSQPQNESDNAQSEGQEQSQAQPESESDQQKQSSENAQPQSQNAQGEEEKQTQAQSAVPSDASLSDEEKEALQRMETLMKKIPDDPAFLLKRKMQLEAQQRQRQRRPAQQRDW